MKMVWQIAAVAGLAAIGTGIWLWTAQPGTPGGGSPGGGPGGGRSAAMRPVMVSVKTAQRGQIAVTFDAVGSLRANEGVTVTSKQTGIVKTILFEEGQQVSTGAVLVELDDTEVRANLAVAEANRRNAEQLLQRAKQLLNSQTVARAKVDEMTAALEGAEAQVRAAQARLRDLTIRAPFAGTTGLRQVSVGALMMPGREITTIDDLSVVKMDFAVPERALSSLRIGGAVQARADALGGETFQGQIGAVDTRIDPLTRTIRVVAELPNPGGRLKPGMFLTVKLPLEIRSDVILIAEEALVPVGDQQFVFAVADGRAQRRAVRIGARQDGLVEVLEGVAAGEAVITRGTQKVRDGAPVAVEGAPAPNAAPTAAPVAAPR